MPASETESFQPVPMLSIDFIYAHDPVKNRILVRVVKELTLIKRRTGLFKIGHARPFPTLVRLKVGQVRLRRIEIQYATSWPSPEGNQFSCKKKTTFSLQFIPSLISKEDTNAIIISSR